MQISLIFEQLSGGEGRSRNTTARVTAEITVLYTCESEDRLAISPREYVYYTYIAKSPLSASFYARYLPNCFRVFRPSPILATLLNNLIEDLI